MSSLHIVVSELTLENNRAGVNRETLMTFNLRCVALSVIPAKDRM